MAKNFSKGEGTSPTVITDLNAEQILNKALSSGDVRFQPLPEDDWSAESCPAYITGEGFTTVARSVSRFPQGPQRATHLREAALDLNKMFGIPVDEATSRIERAIRQDRATGLALEAIGVLTTVSK